MTLQSNLRQRWGTLKRRWRGEPPMPVRVWLRRQWPAVAALALVVVSVLTLDVWLATCGFQGCPTPAQVRQYRPVEGSVAIDRSGRVLGKLSVVRRVNVPLSQVPRHVQQAFVATEDRRFYEHNGLDWRAVVRAVTRNVSSLAMREGFSTITMQVARNTYTPRLMGERSFRRKLLELRYSRLIERSLTKPQILELYLNVIYLGNGTYGVEAASRDLFGKSIRDVSLGEAAVLAALPKGPSTYTPRRSPDRARARRNLVLALMVQEGYVGRERAAAAAEQPLRVARQEWRPAGANSYALDAVRMAVDSALGSGALDVGDVIVFTTIDAAAQRAAERAVARRASAIQAEQRSWYGRTGEVQGAMVAIDPRTGDVRALVGGRGYERGGFNRALSARRQPGSAFKPFVYAAALAAGLTPASLVDDEPVEVEQSDGTIWTPANHGGEYNGRITLRRALMRSANAATVRVSRAVGEPRVVATARRNGITSALAPIPSIALGALEVTPLELVTGYAPFANGGLRVTPRLIRRIESSDGRVLWQSDIRREPVMDPRDAYHLTSMLRSAVDHGTGYAVREWGARGMVAGKTGTTNDGADVWFIGYTPTVVAGFWFGHDTPRPLMGGAASGGTLAAPAWAEFFVNGWRESGGAEAWRAPDDMVMRVIDSYTGELAGDWCPLTQREWFKAGTEPVERCREHAEPTFEDTWAGEVSGKIAEAFKKIFKF